MSWRNIQLGESQCDQDQLILKLFENCTVRCVGVDLEFAKKFSQSVDSKNLILVINKPVWLSELISTCNNYVNNPVETFYIGINRYVIKGNDTDITVANTNNKGFDLINFVGQQLQKQGYTTVQSGHFDHDRGRYFNFVQPLTWLYGTKTSN
jgi:hypothetical protein